MWVGVTVTRRRTDNRGKRWIFVQNVVHAETQGHVVRRVPGTGKIEVVLGIQNTVDGAIVTTCVGGMDQRTERRALDRGAHVVVATPGRLCDHIKRNNIDLSELQAVVLDEADEMLDLGFRDELEFILSEAPEDRRTLLFSATLPRQIVSLAARYQNDALRISTVGNERGQGGVSGTDHSASIPQRIPRRSSS